MNTAAAESEVGMSTSSICDSLFCVDNITNIGLVISKGGACYYYQLFQFPSRYFLLYISFKIKSHRVDSCAPDNPRFFKFSLYLPHITTRFNSTTLPISISTQTPTIIFIPQSVGKFDTTISSLLNDNLSSMLTV